MPFLNTPLTLFQQVFEHGKKLFIGIVMESESQWETTREPFVVGNEVLHWNLVTKIRRTCTMTWKHPLSNDILHWNLVTTNVGTSLSMDYKYGLHPPHLHDGLGQVWATKPRHLT